MPISRVRRPRIWKSPAPCGDADAKEQEARHENPHAPEDEQDHTKVVFAKANVIHNDRILLDVDESRIRSIAGLLKPDTTIGELPYN
jgi:hypothetical protein